MEADSTAAVEADARGVTAQDFCWRIGWYASQSDRPRGGSLVEMAEQAQVPYQLAVFSGGNTDASAMHLVRDGILSAALAMPRRYSHSPVETLDLNDAVHALQLLHQVCLNLPTISEFSFI